MKQNTLVVQVIFFRLLNTNEIIMCHIPLLKIKATGQGVCMNDSDRRWVVRPRMCKKSLNCGNWPGGVSRIRMKKPILFPSKRSQVFLAFSFLTSVLGFPYHGLF